MHARGGLGPSTLTMGDPALVGHCSDLHPGPRQAFVTCEIEHVETVLTSHNLWRPQTMLRMQLDPAEFKPPADIAVSRRLTTPTPSSSTASTTRRARGTPAVRLSKASTSAPSIAAGLSPLPARTSTRARRLGRRRQRFHPPRLPQPRSRHRGYRGRRTRTSWTAATSSCSTSTRQPHGPPHLRAAGLQADRPPHRGDATRRRLFPLPQRRRWHATPETPVPVS